MSKPESNAYEEFVDLLSAGSDSKRILKFHPSDETQQRVFDLLDKMKNEGLSEKEKEEFYTYRALEHLARMWKAREREKSGMA